MPIDGGRWIEDKDKVEDKVKMSYNSFEEMPVWQKAMNLAAKIFDLTEKLPKKRRFWFDVSDSPVRTICFGEFS